MQGLVLEDESWFGARAAVFKKGKQLCSLAAPPPRLLLEDFSASFGKQQINSVRCQTIFLSWTTCFHQNKILTGEQNLFSQGEE